MPVGSDKAVWNCWVIAIALSLVNGVTLLTLGALAETTVGGRHATTLVGHPADVPGLVACQEKFKGLVARQQKLNELVAWQQEFNELVACQEKFKGLVACQQKINGLVACQQKINENLVPSWVECSTRVISTINFCYVMRLCSTFFNFENVQNS